MQRRDFLSGLSLLPLSAMPGMSLASVAYPDRPVSFVVSYTPGSANDILVRLLSPDLGTALGQAIVVENRPGAGGAVGTAYAARAKADGHTLALGSTATLAINPALYKGISYDPRKDFVPVSLLATTPNVLVVPASSAANSAAELVAQSKGKAAGHGLQFSSPGSGSTQHLSAVLFGQLAGINVEHIPYKGPAEAIQGLIGGEIGFGFASLPSVAPSIRAGKLKALGVSSARAVESLPGVKPLAALGYKGFEETDVWFGAVVQAGTPEPVIEALRSAFAGVLQNNSIQDKLDRAGYNRAPVLSRRELSEFVDRQVSFWAGLVRSSGAKVD